MVGWGRRLEWKDLLRGRNGLQDQREHRNSEDPLEAGE